MAVQIAFVFQSPDSTALLNQRLAGLIGKGIYSGGVLTPAGSLNANRSPFFAVGRDGITIWDSEVGTFTYTIGVDNYHVIRGKYNPLGVPSSPVLGEEVLTAAEYNADPDKAYLIVLAVVNPAGAVLVNSDIDYSLREEVGPFERVQLRGTVENEVDLPTGSPNFNRTGDLYIVENDPPLNGGGLYMWDGSVWRLVAAAGAQTLDGAYDDNGGTPGAGRTITVDAGAVELLQNTTSQRQNDPANAALRIRKEGTTVLGDVGLDIVLAQDKDVGSLLIRSLYTDGTNMQVDEPVNVSGSTVTCTRGSSWTAGTVYRGKALLVELTGSSLGNNGLFIVSTIVGAQQVTIRRLDGTLASLTVENGIVANFYSIRTSFGAASVRIGEGAIGSIGVGSIEYYGGVGTTSDIGKLWLVDTANLGWTWQHRVAIAGGSSTFVAGLSNKGMMLLSPASGSEDKHTLEAHTSHGSFAAVRAEHTGTGHGVRAVSATGQAINASQSGTGTNHTLEATCTAAGWPYAAIKANGGTAMGVHASSTAIQAILGSTTGTGARGVWGENLNAADTTGNGIYGKHAGIDAVSILGDAIGSGASIGVRGQTVGSTGIGVHGLNNGLNGTGVKAEDTIGNASCTALEAVAVLGGVAGKFNAVNNDAIRATSSSGIGGTFSGGTNALQTTGSGPVDHQVNVEFTNDNYAYYKGDANTEDPNSVIVLDRSGKTPYRLDYMGRPARGNHFYDDFYYQDWTSHGVNVPPQYVTYASGANARVIGNATTWTNGVVAPYAGTDVGGYAHLAAPACIPTYLSDGIRGRYFARINLAAAPTLAFVGYLNATNPASATRWCGVATGAAIVGYPSGWNAYYDSASYHLESQHWAGLWNLNDFYNIHFYVLTNTTFGIHVNDAPMQTFTIPGGETFSSTQNWSLGLHVRGGISTVYMDYWEWWNNEALKWDEGWDTYPV